jgi:hypothetical protein
MSTPTLPDWLTQFDGEGLPDKVGVAAILGTVDGEGWPHLAYLSAGEILVEGDRLSLALWPTSQTCANLKRRGQAILHVGAEGVVWEARLSLTPRAEVDQHGTAIFDGEVEAIRRHAAPYADVLCLISFRLHDPAATLQRWAEKLAELRAAA